MQTKEPKWSERVKPSRHIANTGTNKLAADLEPLSKMSLSELMEGIGIFNEQRREALRVGVEKGNITLARNSGISVYEKAQEMIDEMVAQNSGKLKPVELHVHTGPVDGLNGVGGYQHMGAVNQFPDLMETSDIAITELGKDPNRLRALLAHELGHTANGDNQVRKLAERVRTGPTHLQEIRANEMGAIIHGNPREYAKAIATFEQAKGSLTHPSTAELRQQTTEWAEHLGKIGATCEKGFIIDVEKALDAMSHSKFSSVAKKVATHATQIQL